MSLSSAVDLFVLFFGMQLGREHRSQPVRQLTRRQFLALSERLDDLVHHYPDIFPVDRLPDAPPASDDERLHRVQLVLDEVTRPVGMNKAIFLPMGGRNVLRSKRRPVVAHDSERRLEAVIEVVNLLESFKLLGMPLDSIRNRYRHYGGYDTRSVADWYGLAPDSIAWFSVHTVSPRLMSDATDLLLDDERKLPLHLRLVRWLLDFLRPTLFEHEARFRHGDAAILDAGFLAERILGRLRVRRVPNAEGGRDTYADLVLYPELSKQDEVLERVLLDDDYGLHADLVEVPQRSRNLFWRIFWPYKRYRLGPKSYAALQAMIDTDGNEREDEGRPS